MILLIEQELNAIRRKYLNIPLGLSDEEREEFLRSTPERKFEIKEPAIEEREKPTRKSTRK